jgi:hypothetical protein
LPFLDYRVYGTDLSNGAALLGYHRANNSLFVSVDEGASQFNSYVCEVSIVTPTLAASTTALQRGSLIQAPQDAAGGLWYRCSLNSFSGCRIRGCLVGANGQMFLSGYINYDGGYQGTHSLYRRSTTLSVQDVVGPIEINGFGIGSADNGGICGGFQAAIPANWQGALGGDTICGNWGLSINGRTSWGPSAVIYNQAEVGLADSVNAQPLLYYNQDHPTLGEPGIDGALWNDAGEAGGIVFVEGTSTILFFTRHTDHYCYGDGTTNPSLDHTQVPGEPPGVIYCYDVEVGGKGQHGNPWTQRVYAYDANELVNVKAGIKQPWEVYPYTWWDFELPQFQYTHYLKSVTYDPVSQLIYLAAQYGDTIGGAFYNAPVIHVYKVTP